MSAGTVARSSAPSEVPDSEPPQLVSDELLRRILVGMGLALAVLLVAGLFFVAGRWATADHSAEPWGNADVGFMQDMIDHHQQALLIANTERLGL